MCLCMCVHVCVCECVCVYKYVYAMDDHNGIEARNETYVFFSRDSECMCLPGMETA